MAIQTREDLWQAIAELASESANDERPLEVYLRALRSLASQYSDRESIDVNTFLRLLRDAFSAPAPDYDPAWANQYSEDPEESGYSGWEATIISQIIDLHEMEAAGTLQDEQRFFGVESPRGARWYNFHPSDYLECAAAGMDDGDAAAHHPDPSPPCLLPNVSWELFMGILWLGQHYE